MRLISATGCAVAAALIASSALAAPPTERLPSAGQPSTGDPRASASPETATPSTADPSSSDLDGPLGAVAWSTDARGNVALEAVLAHAREHAPAVLVAQGRMALGDADLEAAKPIFIADPTLWAGLGGRMTQGEATRFEMQLQAYQQIEIGGERRRRIQAAKKLRALTQADLDRITWEVEVRVREAFREAVVARLKLDTAKRQREFNERLLALVQKQLDEGDIAPLDFRLAEVQAAQAKQLEIDAENAYLVACRLVVVLSGWPGPFEPKSPLEPARPIPAGADLDALAAQHQRELKTLDAAVARAEAMKRLAKRNVLPEPQLGVYFGREKDPFANVGMNVVLGTIGFSIPAWQRNRREIAYARADVAVARSERDALKTRLPSQISAAASRVDATSRQVAVYSESIVPSLESNLDLLQKGYDLGELGVLEVSVARERFFSIQQSVLDAHAAYYRAVADLESLVGTSPFGATPMPSAASDRSPEPTTGGAAPSRE
jgi:cobalt-zinc-cadmium efflux system outer membrane protein